MRLERNLGEPGMLKHERPDLSVRAFAVDVAL